MKIKWLPRHTFCEDGMDSFGNLNRTVKHLLTYPKVGSPLSRILWQTSDVVYKPVSIPLPRDSFLNTNWCWNLQVTDDLYIHSWWTSLCVCVGGRPTLHDPPGFCNPPGFSVHGISQARMLEWVAMPPSRGIFPAQDWKPGLLHWRWILYSLSHLGSQVDVTSHRQYPTLFPVWPVEDCTSQAFVFGSWGTTRLAPGQ